MIRKSIGKMSYDNSDAFKRFLKYTNSKRNTVRCILENIELGRDWSFLDVGCGNGDITIPIAKKVGSTVALDSSKEMISEIKERIMSLDNVSVVHQNAETFSSDQRFDLILLSHLLYYIKEKEEMIEKYFSMLNDKGILLIVTHSESGSFFDILAKFHKIINDVEIRGDRRIIMDKLRKLGHNHKERLFESEIVIPDEREALLLCDFLFEKPLEEIPEETKNMLIDSFREHKTDNRIKLYIKDSLIWVSK